MAVSFPCWKKFKDTDLHKLLAQRTKIAEPITEADKAAYKKAAQELQNETLNDLHNVFHQAGVPNYKEPIQKAAAAEAQKESIPSVSGDVGVGDKSALKELNIKGSDFGFDKPERKNYEEGEAGDKKYAEDTGKHNKNVDDTILGIKEEGTLIDREGNEYLVTQTSQGTRVVNKLADGTEGSDISYRNGKRISADVPFTKGFTFKPKEKSLPKEQKADEKINQQGNETPDAKTNPADQQSQQQAKEGGQPIIEPKKEGEGTSQKTKIRISADQLQAAQPAVLEPKNKDFHDKVDKAAASLIKALSTKLPPGTRKSGIGIEEIVNGAAAIIKKAYDAGTNIKAAIEEAVKYVKDQFRSNNLGDVDEDVLRKHLDKDVLDTIKKEKEAEIKTKRKEAIQLRKALKDIDVYSRSGLEKSQVEEIFRKQNLLTPKVQQIIDKIYDRLEQTEGTKQNEKKKEETKIEEGKKILDEIFAKIKNGQKVPKVFVRLTTSDAADLIPYLKGKYSTYKGVSLDQLEEVADSLIEIFGLDVARDMVKDLDMNEKPIAMAKVAMKLREEGRNEEAAIVMADLIQTGTAAGQTVKSFDRVKTILGSVSDPTFRTEFQKAMYERMQAERKAAEAEFGMQSEVFKEKISDLEKQLHEKTINDNKSFFSKLVDKICGVRKKK